MVKYTFKEGVYAFLRKEQYIPMATIITNRATVNYSFGSITATAVSNITNTVLSGALSIRKSSLSERYRIGQEITYIITLTNNGSGVIGNVTVVDNLGSFATGGSVYTPLTYVGPAQLYVNGEFIDSITPTVSASGLIFNIESIPASSNVQIIYIARVNSFASGESGAYITNSATADGDCNCLCEETESDSNTIFADEYADLRITKSVCPNPVICGGEISYVIDLYNYGNLPASNVTLSDTFEPALADISVSVDGVILPESDYSYENGVLTLPANDGKLLAVPAAEFIRNILTGEIEIIPGHLQVVIVGRI